VLGRGVPFLLGTLRRAILSFRSVCCLVNEFPEKSDVKVKVKQSLNRPGVAQRVPGS
jgi:hypothetical protein